MPMEVVHNNYSPKQAAEICSRAGAAKGNMRIDKIFFSAVNAGCLLAFACAGALSTNSAPWYQDNAPGLIRMIGAVIFPWGLVAIILTGSDLCTASFMYTTMAALHRRLSPWKMLMHWFITFFGNLAGSLLVVGLLTGYGGVFDTDPYKTEAITFSNKKAWEPKWSMIFLRGIGANWLVCLACYLAMMARELFSKVVAIWWPTFCFVCLGLDHVVANMFFIPQAIFVGSPTISVSYYIWKSMIPTLLGNIVGGGLCVATLYWYLYLLGESTPIVIDGDQFDLHSQPLVGQEPETNSPQRNPSSNEEKKSAENMV